MQLVLSLFPGADLFGMAFSEEGFCVVRGPDRLWGGNINDFTGMPGKFDGIIGGPPCKVFSQASRGTVAREGNLIPEFLRVVKECGPKWFVMENVPQAADYWPGIEGYVVQLFRLNAWDYGNKSYRDRCFWVGSSDGRIFKMEEPLLDRYKARNPLPCILGQENSYSGTRKANRVLGRGMTLGEVKDYMGLKQSFDTPALLNEYKFKVIGNGVPLPLGAAVARMIKRSICWAPAVHPDHNI